MTVLGFNFVGIFTIICAYGDNHSFMGGSDVLHRVWVSLTGTIVAPLWAHWSVVGVCFGTFTLMVYIIHGNGTPLIVFIMGPRLGNIARGI